jgi:chemotaxis response regulator CheB
MTYADFKVYNSESPHKILVVNRGSLLDEGIVRLISSRTSLDVSTIDFNGEDVLVKDIVSRCPEVLVMGQNRGVKLEKLYKLLTSNPALAKLRMIIFHSNDNSVDVFSQQQHNLILVDDFVELVQRA